MSCGLGSHIRPYYPENTASRPICEVKQGQVRLVLAWGTSWEVRMLYIFLTFLLLCCRVRRHITLLQGMQICNSVCCRDRNSLRVGAEGQWISIKTKTLRRIQATSATSARPPTPPAMLSEGDGANRAHSHSAKKCIQSSERSLLQGSASAQLDTNRGLDCIGNCY